MSRLLGPLGIVPHCLAGAQQSLPLSPRNRDLPPPLVALEGPMETIGCFPQSSSSTNSELQGNLFGRSTDGKTTKCRFPSSYSTHSIRSLSNVDHHDAMPTSSADDITLFTQTSRRCRASEKMRSSIGWN